MSGGNGDGNGSGSRMALAGTIVNAVVIMAVSAIGFYVNGISNELTHVQDTYLTLRQHQEFREKVADEVTQIREGFERSDERIYQLLMPRGEALAQINALREELTQTDRRLEQLREEMSKMPAGRN